MPIIEVTADLIEQAKRRDSSHCMIAEAIKLAIPDAKRVSVDLATIRYTDRKGRRIVHLTPRPAQVALLMFDNGEPLGPFSVSLVRPAQVIEKRRSSQTVTSDVKRPQRRGGKAPPIGPLAGGDLPAAARRGDLRTGRVRRYGLKGITP